MIPSERRRVVLTGVGSVSALGTGGFEAVGRALEEARSRIAPIRAFPLDGIRSRLGGEVPEGSLARLVALEEARRLSRICQLSVAACRVALRDAGLDPAGERAGLGLVVGTEFGDIRSSEEFFAGFLKRGPLGLSPMIFPSTVMNTMAASAAIAVGALAASITFNQTTVAGELAIARAATMVANGRMQMALAGGVDEISPVLHRTLSALGTLSPMDGGSEECRPFDRRHNGAVRGEGATFIVIEPLETAVRRGATIRAEITGVAWGNHPVGWGHAPPSGAPRGEVVRRAMARAGLVGEALGWAYLSGTGDPLLDDWQLDSLAAVFDSHAPRLTSLTPLCGDHAGLGALRTAGAAWTAETRHLPPLTTLSDPVRTDCAFATGDRPSEVSGPGLVHGIARGGTEVTLVLSPLDSEIA